MWPLLPGFILGYVCFGGAGFEFFTTAAIFTVAIFVALVFLARSSQANRSMAAVFALIVSVPTSVIAYVAFRW